MLPACRVRSLGRVGPLVILPALGALEQFLSNQRLNHLFEKLARSRQGKKRDLASVQIEWASVEE